MQTNLHFKLNQPHVVAENFGDEVVAIHLERGNYYSIEKSGVVIWALAIAGTPVDEIVAVVAQPHAGNVTGSAATVRRFLEELQQAELIVPSVNQGKPTASVTAVKGNLPLGRQPFEPPVLREYTDMQDLLLLDPIHDVDAAGWPSRK